MKEHKIHVFYSSEDKQSYRIIGSLLKRLELSARYWNSSKNPGLPTLSFNFQNTADALSPLTEEQLLEINNTQSSVIILVAPNLLLSENLLTSQAGKVLLKGNAESLRLFVYCQKIAFKEVLVTSRSNHHWITGSSGQHLTYGTIESTVDDAACDANEEIQRFLKLWLADKSTDSTATTTPEVNATKGNTMSTPEKKRQKAQEAFVKAAHRAELIKFHLASSTFLTLQAIAMVLLILTAMAKPSWFGYLQAGAFVISAWVAAFTLAIKQAYKADKVFADALDAEEEHNRRNHLTSMFR